MRIVQSKSFLVPAIMLLLTLTFRSYCEEGGSGPTGEILGDVAAIGEATSEPALPRVEDGTISLSLEQALSCVLVRNLDLEVQRYLPQLANANIELQYAPFDPVLSLLMTNTDIRSQSGLRDRMSLGITGADVRSMGISPSISKKFAMGTQVSAGTELRRDDFATKVDDLSFRSEEYGARNYVTVTQPLLKGFGRDFNTAQIRIAEKQFDVERLLLGDRIEEILAGVETGYWELVFAVRNVEIAKESMELAKDFLRLAESRLNAGAGIRVDVLEAKAALANREADLYSAENAVKDAADVLRTLLGLTDDAEMWAAGINPSGLPEVLPEIPDLDACLKLAGDKRRDYRVIKIQIEQGEISIQVAQRETLPSLDVFATYAKNGLEDQPGRAYKTTWDERFREYTVGLQFTYLLGNHAARANYEVATLTRDQARISLRLLEDQIIREVRTSWRGLGTELRRAKATEEAERLAGQKLADMQSRYEAGRATSTDVFDFQEDLTRARVEVTRARINALEASVALLRAMGVLADTRGVLSE